MHGVIGVPTRNTMPSSFLQQFLSLRRPGSWRLILSTGTNLARQRNDVVQAMHPDDQWLLFVDDDQIFPPDALERLLAWDVPIIGGLYPARLPSHIPTAGYIRDQKYFPITVDDIKTNGLVEVDYVATGFLLIHREALDAVGDPWFEIGQTDSTSMGEDVWFCKKAKDKGFQVYVDTGLHIGHLIDSWIEFDKDGNLVGKMF